MYSMPKAGGDERGYWKMEFFRAQPRALESSSSKKTMLFSQG